MAKELYLYTPIYSFFAENLISKLEENSREDIVLRINSGGGSVFAGWGIAAKLAEKKNGKITIKVDGLAASMATTLLFYADHVQALPTSNIMIHRGDGPTDTPEDKALLAKVNSDMRTRMEKRINSVKLKELKGMTVQELFENEERKDIWLTAKEAKDVGLIHEITSMDEKEIEANTKAANQEFYEYEHKFAAETASTPTTMTIEEILAKFPAVHAQIMALGAAKAAEKERSRIKAWSKFAAVDPEAVTKGIDSGEDITMLEAVELMEKKATAKNLTALKEESEENDGAAPAADAEKGAGTAGKPEKAKVVAEAKAKEIKEFASNVNTILGIKDAI